MVSDDKERIAHYQARIQELRAKAETLLHIAEDYEKLAAMAKRRLANGDSRCLHRAPGVRAPA